MLRCLYYVDTKEEVMSTFSFIARQLQFCGHMSFSILRIKLIMTKSTLELLRNWKNVRRSSAEEEWCRSFLVDILEREEL